MRASKPIRSQRSRRDQSLLVSCIVIALAAAFLFYHCNNTYSGVPAGYLFVAASSMAHGSPDATCSMMGDSGAAQCQADRRTVGIVGAGISGLVLATHLQEGLGSKVAVTVLEWGRGPGGRTARRRVKIENGEEVWFDHANPYFSVTSDAFRQGLVASWQAKGFVDRWRARLDSGVEHPDLWVGTPSNHAVCKALSEQLLASGGAALFGRHAKDAIFKDNQWHLKATNRLDGDSEELHQFDALVLSDKLLVLPNQYAVLRPDDARALAIPEKLESTGQVALLLAFDPPLDIQSDLIHPAGGPIEVLVRDSSKPGRSFTADVWTARSSATYAAQHLVGESLDDEAAILKELLREFLKAVGSEQEPVFANVFAWDHAQPSSQLVGHGHAFDAERRLGLCGDFFQPGQSSPVSGVEAAALSGLSLAKALMPLMSAL